MALLSTSKRRARVAFRIDRAEISDAGDRVRVHFRDGVSVNFSALWLRDNEASATTANGQRVFETLALVRNREARTVKRMFIDREGVDLLRIVWQTPWPPLAPGASAVSHHSESCFSGAWLRRSSAGHEEELRLRTERTKRTLWTAGRAPQQCMVRLSAPPCVRWGALEALPLVHTHDARFGSDWTKRAINWSSGTVLGLAVAGVAPTALVFRIGITNALAPGQTLTICASSPIWSSSTQPSSCTTGLADAIAAYTTTATSLVITAGSASLASGDAVITCEGGLAPNPAAGTKVTFSVVSQSSTIQLTGQLGYTTTGGDGGDGEGGAGGGTGGGTDGGRAGEDASEIEQMRRELVVTRRALRVAKYQASAQREATARAAAYAKAIAPAAISGELDEANAALLDMLRKLRRFGFVLIKECGAAPNTVLKVARRLGYVRTTNYGATFDVVAKPPGGPGNLAYTSVGLSLHTDNPYRDPCPGIQLLHCLVPARKGGESLIADGFAVAQALRERDAAAFSDMSTLEQRFRYVDGTANPPIDLRTERKQIALNSIGDVTAVYYNNRSACNTMKYDVDMVERLYIASAKFGSLANAEEFALSFKLEAGDVLVMDNTRTLHGRTSYEGSDGVGRFLQGCYIDADHPRAALQAMERLAPSGEVDGADVSDVDGAADASGAVTRKVGGALRRFKTGEVGPLTSRSRIDRVAQIAEGLPPMLTRRW